MTTKLIGVHGPLNSGKDTVTNYIIMAHRTERHKSLDRYAFAKPIKEACKVMFGFTDEQLEDRVLKETVDPFWGFTPRRAFQLLGTEYGRDLLRKDIWIKRAEMEVKNNASKNMNGTVISDVRYQNEADWIRSQPNSLIVFIEAPGLIRDEKYNHTSENGIERLESDALIINDKTIGINNLYSQIDKIFGF